MSASEAARQREIEIQRAYYAETAHRYDDTHVNQEGEHDFALRFLVGAVQYLGIRSILDVGSGTGRGLLEFARAMPEVTAVGIEPSAELREIGYSKGLSRSQLIDGDAMKLAFDDDSFDLVCEFGALHHIPEAVQGGGRDVACFAEGDLHLRRQQFWQGGRLSRLLKQTINAVGLWPLATGSRPRAKDM